MASGFPGSIDNFSDPLANSPLNSPSHATLHSDVNDAVEKIETYMGLVKVIPTGATNGTVAANGVVTIGNAVSSVSVTCFSALYDNYQILIEGSDWSSGGQTANLTFGSANVNSYYGSLYWDYWSGTTGVVRRNNAGNIAAYFGGSNDDTACTMTIFGPFATRRTLMTSVYHGDGYSGWASGQYAGTASFTSFTLTCGAGTMTGGRITVYGYRI